MKIKEIKEIYCTAFPELSGEQISRISIIAEHLIRNHSKAAMLKAEQNTFMKIQKIIEEGRHDALC